MAKSIFSKLWGAIRPKNLEERLINHLTKNYCREQGYAFIPLSLQDEDLPEFAEDINRIIEEHARKDLPHAQFQGLRSPNPEDNVEIGGILGYNGEIFEINYSPPNAKNMRYFGRGIECFVESEPIPLDNLNLADVVIDWHSHPINVFNLIDAPSNGDMDYVDKMLPIIGKKPLYFVIFSPVASKSSWYIIKTSNL